MAYLQWRRFDHDREDNITKAETSAQEGRLRTVCRSSGGWSITGESIQCDNGTRTSAVDAEGSRRRESTSIIGWIYSVLHQSHSGALERKVYTGCVQAHAASASSRAVVSHGRTCAHQPWVVLQQRSARAEADQCPLRQSSHGDVTVVVLGRDERRNYIDSASRGSEHY